MKKILNFIILAILVINILVGIQSITLAKKVSNLEAQIVEVKAQPTEMQDKIVELEKDIKNEIKSTNNRFDAAVEVFEIMGKKVDGNYDDITDWGELMDSNTKIYNAKFRALGY